MFFSCICNYLLQRLKFYRYETAGLVAVARSMDISVAYIIQVPTYLQILPSIFDHRK